MAAMMERDAYEAAVKKSKETIQMFRDFGLHRKGLLPPLAVENIFYNMIPL